MELSIEDIFAAIERAPSDEKVALAEALLAKYDGEDKDLISGDILSAAVLSSQ